MTRPEEWRPVAGWEGLYVVSSQGRLRRLETGRLIGGGEKRRKLVRLYRDGKPYNAPIHRLVCEAFHGPAPEGKPLVLHWNDVPWDNRASNLRWGTDSDNQRDSVRNGKHGNTRKRSCQAGHPLSGDNLRVTSSGRRECRECGNELRRAWKYSKRGEYLSEGDPRHGTATGYGVYKCRCEPCVQSHRISAAKGLDSRANRGLPEGDERHGTQTGYKQWKCRCPECRKSNAEYESARKKRSAERLRPQN